jgi:hypothetical protein
VKGILEKVCVSVLFVHARQTITVQLLFSSKVISSLKNRSLLEMFEEDFVDSRRKNTGVWKAMAEKQGLDPSQQKDYAEDMKATQKDYSSVTM